MHRVLVAAAADVLGQAEPTTAIGIDETRARSDRWLLGEVGWRRSDPWMTSIVDLDAATCGGIIGLAPAGPAPASKDGSACRAATSAGLSAFLCKDLTVVDVRPGRVGLGT